MFYTIDRLINDKRLHCAPSFCFTAFCSEGWFFVVCHWSDILYLAIRNRRLYLADFWFERTLEILSMPARTTKRSSTVQNLQCRVYTVMDRSLRVVAMDLVTGI